MVAVHAASLLLLMYAGLALLDGFYLHLWKYRLYSHPESRYEHKLHTARALVFPFVLYVLFAGNFAGILWWTGVLAAAGDLLIGVLDVLEENNARAIFGGLSRLEYLVHVLANGVHFAWLALICIAKPPEAWDLSASVILSDPYPPLAGLAFWCLLPGAGLAAFLHLWLLQQRYLTAQD